MQKVSRAINLGRKLRQGTEDDAENERERDFGAGSRLLIPRNVHCAQVASAQYRSVGGGVEVQLIVQPPPYYQVRVVDQVLSHLHLVLSCQLRHIEYRAIGVGVVFQGVEVNEGEVEEGSRLFSHN